MTKESPLISDSESYNNLYHIIQNDLNVNGKEKATKALNNMLDNNIRQISTNEDKHSPDNDPISSLRRASFVSRANTREPKTNRMEAGLPRL